MSANVSAAFAQQLAEFLNSKVRLYAFEAFLGNPHLHEIGSLVAFGVVTEHDLDRLPICETRAVRSMSHASRIISLAFRLIAEERLTPHEVHGFMKSERLQWIARSSKSKGAPTLTDFRMFLSALFPPWGSPDQTQALTCFGDRFVSPARAARSLRIAEQFGDPASMRPSALNHVPLHPKPAGLSQRGVSEQDGLLFPILASCRPYDIFERFFLRGRSPFIRHDLLTEKVLRSLDMTDPRWYSAVVHPDMLGKTLTDQRQLADDLGGSVGSLELTLTYLLLCANVREELPHQGMRLRVADPFVRRGKRSPIAVSILNHRELEIVEFDSDEKNPAVGALLMF